MKNILKPKPAMMMMLTVMLFLGACSKSSSENPAPDPEPGKNFPLTDLAVTVTSTKDDTESREYRFDYDIKNTSTTDYVSSAFPEEIYRRFTITATDGTSYESEGPIENVKAGKSYVNYEIITYGAGKTIDASKNKVELFYK